MTLAKAQEIIDLYIKTRLVPNYSDHIKAIKLSGEALKQIKESRFDPSTWEPQLLPGED